MKVLEPSLALLSPKKNNFSEIEENEFCVVFVSKSMLESAILFTNIEYAKELEKKFILVIQEFFPLPPELDEADIVFETTWASEEPTSKLTEKIEKFFYHQNFQSNKKLILESLKCLK